VGRSGAALGPNNPERGKKENRKKPLPTFGSRKLGRKENPFFLSGRRGKYKHGDIRGGPSEGLKGGRKKVTQKKKKAEQADRNGVNKQKQRQAGQHYREKKKR